MTSKTCDIDEGLIQTLKDFRFAKSKDTRAVIIKIDRNNLLISVDQELPKTTIDEIVEELPENIPRYVIISYEWTHNDGRKSYPLVFLYWSPLSTKPEQHMLYASAKLQLQQAVDLNSKVYEIRNPAELTEQWLIDRLNGKRQ